MKNKFKVLSLIIAIISILLIIAGVVIYFYENQEFVVKFELDNGEVLPDQIIKRGGFVTEPKVPYKKGHLFDNFKNGDDVYDFLTPVNSNLVLKAVYEEVNESDYSYFVTFVCNNCDIPDEWIDLGKKVKEPKLEDENFIGWYLGEELYDFESPVTMDLDLVAHYKN